MSDTAKDLARYAAYARACCEALPVDEDAERRVSQMLAKARANQPPPRKLGKK